MTTTPPPLSSAITLFITFLVAVASPPLPLVASSTIAVTRNPSSTTTTTVCGIFAGKPTQSIQCYHNNHTIAVSPNASLKSISGGRDLFCGLRTGGFSLLCWDTAAFLPKRIYYSYSYTRPLTGLAVGTSQICAIRAYDGVALCWRFHSPDETLKFRLITSGGGFSCGILKNNSRVICWGGSEIGAEIQGQFGNLTMLSLVAGESQYLWVGNKWAFDLQRKQCQWTAQCSFPFAFRDLKSGSRFESQLRNYSKKSIPYLLGRRNEKIPTVK